MAAVLLHEKEADLLNPLTISSFLEEGEKSKSSNIEMRISLSKGSKESAASPTTSGNEEALLQITGHPTDIASKGGIPKPS